MDGVPDPAWEASLRADWPGKRRILTVLGPGEVEERSVSDDQLDADPANDDVHGAIPAEVRRASEALDK